MRSVYLEELFIGAWVRRKSEPSKPVIVSGLFLGGDMYVSKVTSEGEPYDVNINTVLPLQIEERTLRQFGFVPTKGDNVWLKVIDDMRLTIALRWRHGYSLVRRVAISGRVNCWNEEIRYVHELQRFWMERVMIPYGVRLVLIWEDERP